MKTLLRTIDYDILRALQLSYYVGNISLVSDYDYDMMEKEYRAKTGKEMEIGADDPFDYTPAQRALALYLQFSCGKQKKKRS